MTAERMLHNASRYSSLALPLGDYVPAAAVIERFSAIAASLGRRSRAGIRIPLAAPRAGKRSRGMCRSFDARGEREGDDRLDPSTSPSIGKAISSSASRGGPVSRSGLPHH